ncbi:uncharacterized protein LOC133897376 isoform X2 [Phragmites australis]|uniref:uncharacterized protein LOC133897376 isoform X2 n=1 Tax=Phragmites australis TaxID=29695 RepID=UPI002D7884F0|nr:uncharacterized protein LOC133897376 isoform X2 [Phragmites australis]
MGTRDRGGGGGSASRVGDGDVDLGEGWDWGSIPRLLSSACLFLCSGGCFGCYDKAAKQLGELSKSLITQDHNPTVGDTFWSTTTIEIEPADLRGVSSINISNWGLDQHGTGSSHSQPELVNNVGMQHTRVCLDPISHFLKPFLFMRWLIFSWTSGSKRGCMTSSNAFAEIT